VRLNESKMKRNVKESNMSNNDVRSKVNRPKSILKSLQPNKENDDTSFVSGENFDFSKPIGTPYLQSPVAGPMTRRNSIESKQHNPVSMDENKVTIKIEPGLEIDLMASQIVDELLDLSISYFDALESPERYTRLTSRAQENDETYVAVLEQLNKDICINDFEHIEKNANRSKIGTLASETPFLSTNKRKIDIEHDVEDLKVKQNGCCNEISLSTPKSSRVNVKRHKKEDSRKQHMNEKENEESDDNISFQDEPVPESQLLSPVPQSHWLRRGLDLCTIM